MNLSAFDLLLIASTSLGVTSLFAVLLVRNRWREFPVFTIFAGFESILIPFLFVTSRYGSRDLYSQVFWVSVFIEFVLQLGVVGEIARIVMRPTGTWIRDAKKTFVIWGTIGVLLAAAIPWLVSPPSPTFLGRLEVRGNLFTSLVICELIAVITRTSKSLGLGWRNHVMALGNGWTAWAVIAILVDGLHSYLGVRADFALLEHVRMVVWLAALGYWNVQFWLEEPVRKPISPELSDYIQNLHRRMKMDLDSLDAQR